MKAQCLCGVVSLETIEDHELHACHCGKCRIWGSGTSFILVIWSPEITGNEHIAYYQPPEWTQRCFCKHYGTHLFVQAGNDYYINAGLFADNVGLETTSQIFIDYKAPYYDLANNTLRLIEAEFLEMAGAAG